PIAETVIAAGLLASLDASGEHRALLEQVLAGQSVLSIAFRDVALEPLQWISGGAVARAVLAREGEQIVLITVPPGDGKGERNLASTPIAQLRLGAGAARAVLSSSDQGRKQFAQALEEWKLLMAAALAGLAREAIETAAAYARERVAFGQPIGTYQGISHPLAD